MFHITGRSRRLGEGASAKTNLVWSIGTEMSAFNPLSTQFLEHTPLSLTRFARDVRGSVAMIFGIAAPVLLAAGGMAIDLGLVSLQKTRMQSAVDAATLAAARELQVSKTDKSQIASVAKQVMVMSLGKDGNRVSLDISIGSDAASLTVKASLPVTTYFMDWTGGKGISVEAVAGIHTSGVPLCVLGLAMKDGKKVEPGLTLNENARLTGDGCAVYSNAPKKDAIESNSGATLEAGLICSAGGVEGDEENFDPAPLTDCPAFQDPLKNRPEPTIGSCDFKDFRIGISFKKKEEIKEKQIKEKIKNETAAEASGGKGGKKHFDEKKEKPVDTSKYDRSEVTIEPGVYCGGLMIGGGIAATFSSGDYIIKDGPLYVTEEASIKGENVGFFFTGKDSNLYFGPHTKINLTAPTDGEMAGILFFEERGNKKVRPHAILSDGARKLEGTIYLPTGHLYIDADAPIADKSAYTAIIVSRLELFAGPHLVLNTDYAATDVPVPEGVGAMSGEVFLQR